MIDLRYNPPPLPLSALQQSEQREQQRLSLQRLSLSLPHLTFPIPRLLFLLLLGAPPADAGPPLLRLLPRLRLHLSGRLPVQVALADASGELSGEEHEQETPDVNTLLHSDPLVLFQNIPTGC